MELGSSSIAEKEGRGEELYFSSGDAGALTDPAAILGQDSVKHWLLGSARIFFQVLNVETVSPSSRESV